MEPEPLPLAPEALLEQGEWVRRVARALVLDEHRAEDLAQQVWVKALEKPPRVRTSLRAWLGTVLRHAAADLRRGGARGRAREEAAAREEALPSTEAVVARAETLHRVSAAALGLREPYRTVILLRYFEDLAPPEIARRLDVPLETVRTRLRRGLETLREELDGESGDRREWVLALLPFAIPGLRLPSLPLPPAEPGAWSGGDAAARAALATAKEIGAMTVRTAVATGLAILVSVGAALWFLRDVEAEPVPDAAMSAAGGRRGKPKAPPPPATEVGGVGYIGSTATEHPKPPIHIPTELEWEEAARGHSGPPLVLENREETIPLKDGEAARILEDAAAGQKALDAWGAAVAKGEKFAVRGIVADADTGLGIPCVPLQAFTSGGEILNIVGGETGTDGTFEARGSFKGAWSIGAGWRDSTSEYGYVLLKRTGKPEGDLRLELRKGLLLEGRIEDADGRAFAGSAIVLTWALDAKGKAIPETQQWVSTSTGEFRITGVDPGPHLVRASSHGNPGAAGEPGTTGVVEPVEAGAKGIVVRLPRPAAIEGRIVDESGNPVAAAGVIRIRVSGQAAGLLRQTRRGTVPGDGTFRSPLLDPGETYDLEASGFEGFKAVTREGVAGGAANVELVLVREL